METVKEMRARADVLIEAISRSSDEQVKSMINSHLKERNHSLNAIRRIWPVVKTEGQAYILAMLDGANQARAAAYERSRSTDFEAAAWDAAIGLMAVSLPKVDKATLDQLSISSKYLGI